jgi:Pyridoxamine 5'-phosphate oxidase like
MANEEQFDRVWEIIERVGVCMLTTRFAGGLRARPLEARPNRDDGQIWFVTDLHSGKQREIESEDDVGLVFIDAHEKGVPLDHGTRTGASRPRQGRCDLEIDRQCMVARSGRSKCLRVARHAHHRGTLGRAGEKGRRRIRIGQGAAHRHQTQSRGEPQGDGQSTVMQRLH